MDRAGWRWVLCGGMLEASHGGADGRLAHVMVVGWRAMLLFWIGWVMRLGDGQRRWRHRGSGSGWRSWSVRLLLDGVMRRTRGAWGSCDLSVEKTILLAEAGSWLVGVLVSHDHQIVAGSEMAHLMGVELSFAGAGSGSVVGDRARDKGIRSKAAGDGRMVMLASSSVLMEIGRRRRTGAVCCSWVSPARDGGGSLAGATGLLGRR
ncbi:hypothetical protein ACLOJK_000772 [Asimina triloba]